MKKKKNAELESFPEPGVSISHTQTSEAFMLIVFMVGDLFFVYKNITLSLDPAVYKGLDSSSFVTLKNKILKKHKESEFTHLDIYESIRLYMLVDIVCKAFVDDTNETLRKLAIENVSISEEEYEILRINFLRYGQSLIEKMNEKFEKNKIFYEALDGLKG